MKKTVGCTIKTHNKPIKTAQKMCTKCGSTLENSSDICARCSKAR